MKQVEKTSAQALGTSGTSGTPRITPEVAAFDPGRVPVAKRVGSREPGAGSGVCLGAVWAACGGRIWLEKASSTLGIRCFRTGETLWTNLEKGPGTKEMPWALG